VKTKGKRTKRQAEKTKKKVCTAQARGPDEGSIARAKGCRLISESPAKHDTECTMIHLFASCSVLRTVDIISRNALFCGRLTTSSKRPLQRPECANLVSYYALLLVACHFRPRFLFLFFVSSIVAEPFFMSASSSPAASHKSDELAGWAGFCLLFFFHALCLNLWRRQAFVGVFAGVLWCRRGLQLRKDKWAERPLCTFSACCLARVCMLLSLLSFGPLICALDCLPFVACR
jgi:hypothetical protein